MANVRLTAALATAMADAVNTALNAGAAALIKIYDGAQPATADTAVGAQVLLAQLTCADPASTGAAAGVLTFSAIVDDSSANATGVATWARFTTSTGAAVFDCDVGEVGSGATIELNSVNIAETGLIEMSAFTFTVPTLHGT